MAATSASAVTGMTSGRALRLRRQNFPDAPNHDNFPSAVLRPGETYTQTSVYAFEMNKEGRSYVRNRRKTQDKTIGHE